MYMRLISRRTYHRTWLRLAPRSLPAGLFAAVMSAGINPPFILVDGLCPRFCGRFPARSPLRETTYVKIKNLYAGGEPGRSFVLKRKRHRLVEFRRQVGGDIKLHYGKWLCGGNEERSVQGHGFDEMHRFGRHRAGIDMPNRFAGHRRQRKDGSILHGVQHHVAMGVVNHQSAFGSYHLDPRRREVGIAGWQAPAATDDEGETTVHGHGNPLKIGNIASGRFAHRAVVHLRINAHRLCRLETPTAEVKIVRRFHGGWRKLDAATDFLPEAARNMSAHQNADGLADRTVADALFDVSELRIEPLRIADREFEPIGAGDGDKFVSLFELQRDWLF